MFGIAGETTEALIVTIKVMTDMTAEIFVSFQVISISVNSDEKNSHQPRDDSLLLLFGQFLGESTGCTSFSSWSAGSVNCGPSLSVVSLLNSEFWELAVGVAVGTLSVGDDEDILSGKVSIRIV